MGRYARGTRDGSGPYQGSYQRGTRGIGRRQARGEVCPITGKLGLNDIKGARRGLGLKDIKPMGKPRTTVLGTIRPFVGKSKMGFRKVKLM